MLSVKIKPYFRTERLCQATANLIFLHYNIRLMLENHNKNIFYGHIQLLRLAPIITCIILTRLVGLVPIIGDIAALFLPISSFGKSNSDLEVKRMLVILTSLIHKLASVVPILPA